MAGAIDGAEKDDGVAPDAGERAVERIAVEAAFNGRQLGP